MDTHMDIEVANGPAIKRQKLSAPPAKPQRPAGTSRLFAPYRTVGLVSPTAVPFTSIPLGKTTFQITTSVGRSLQTYDLRRGLNLVFITRPQTPGLITASAAWRERVYGAWSTGGADGARGVWVFRRGKREAALEVPRGWREDVKSFCCFGGWVVGVCETQFLVWKSSTHELYTTLQGVSPVPFTNCVTSLPTFLNKIIVGRHDGSAEIWNVSSGKLIYAILPPSTAYGAVTAIEPTPALALVAVAYEKGPLLIHDIRADQTVIQLSTPAAAPITSITFRTDSLGAGEDGQSPGVMATASTASGDVTLWDLNHGGRKAGVLRSAHAHPTQATPGGISRVQFLAGQAVLVSSGLDNSLKTWISDQTPFSPIPRSLHHRGGHGAPVTHLHFLPSASDGSDDTGKWLMSASLDRSLWGWSLRRDGQSTELSQGAVQSKAKKQGLLSSGSASQDAYQDLKCPPITAIACSLNRDGGIGATPGKQPIWTTAKSGSKKVDAETSAMTGWESVVTAHKNDHRARTWFWGRKRAGRWAFPTSDDSPVTSVAISPCGTFAVVGSATGGVEAWNLQSGLPRQRFPARLTPTQAKQLQLDMQQHGLREETSADGRKVFYRGQGKHSSAVVGLAVDNTNSTLVSASADGQVKFWDFTTGLLRHRLDWPSASAPTGITALQLHRGADLIALACSDGCLRVLDLTTRALIRELWPSRPVSTIPAELQSRALTAFSFSSDAQWLAASIDRTVLLWDLPTGHLIDAFNLHAPCTGLAFSPTGEYLATASSNSVGVDVWSNRTLFSPTPTRLINAAELSAIVSSKAQQAPTASGEGAEPLLAPASDHAEEEEEADEDLDILAQDPEDMDALSADLLTLSLVPKARWQNLLHLDLIRQRNRPKQPPTKPEKAPFFLPALERDRPGTALAPAATDAKSRAVGQQAEIERERRAALARSADGNTSTFSALLRAAARSSPGEAKHCFAPLLAHLSTLNPSAADLALRSLYPSLSQPNPHTDLLTFLHALIFLLESRADFELGQAWMAVLLRLHGEVLAAEPELREGLRVWGELCKGERERVGRLVGFVAGVGAWVGAPRV